MDKQLVTGNYIKHATLRILHQIAVLLSSGAIVQTLLAFLGVSFARVEIYTSITLIVQVISMFTCTVIADKFRSIKKVISACMLFFPAIFVSLFLPSVGVLSDIEITYTIILIGSIICNLALGVYNVVSYKLMYDIMPIKEYGKVESIEGILSYGVSVGGSFLLSLFVGLFDYRLVMSVAFFIGGVLWIICAIISSSFKVLTDSEKGENTSENVFVSKKENDITFRELLLRPIFLKTMFPTFLRGIGAGVFGLVVTLGFRQDILTPETATYTTIITSLSAILGCLIYFAVEKKVNHNVVIIASGVLTGVLIPFIIVGNNLWLFYIFLFLSNSTITVASIAHPVLVTETVEYNMVGRYTAWRMLFLTFGQSIPGFFIGALYDCIGGLGVLLVGGATTMIAFLWLGLVMKKKDRTSLSKEKQ